jgi:hypothetical protein
MSRVCALCALAAVLSVRPALAQTPPTVIVSVNGGVQPGTNRLSEAIELTKYHESAPVTADLPASAVPFFDAGANFRIYRALGASVAVSALSDTDGAAVEGQIPHPFYFSRARSISGQVGVERREVAVHLDGTYLLESSRVSLLFFGGASFFNIEQDIVTDVSYDETYPYDAATYTTAAVAQVKVSKTGYNVGADVIWKLSRRWGIGGLVRFSRATVPLVEGGVDAGTMDVGGLMVGAGLRLIF